MARLARLTLGDHLHCVSQMGANKQLIFTNASDYQYFLELLRRVASCQNVAIHAYVLLPRVFYLLATPANDAGLPKLMQSIGRDYVRYYNRLHDRTGTLWNGRYRSTLIEPSRYLLPCMTCLDLLPVTERLVNDASDYPWSSYGHQAGVRHDKLLSTHPLVWRLGNTPFDREAEYVATVQAGVAPSIEFAFFSAVQSGWPLGDAAFEAALQGRTDRRIRKKKVGRPSTAA